MGFDVALVSKCLFCFYGYFFPAFFPGVSSFHICWISWLCLSLWDVLRCVVSVFFALRISSPRQRQLWESDREGEDDRERERERREWEDCLRIKISFGLVIRMNATHTKENSLESNAKGYPHLFTLSNRFNSVYMKCWRLAWRSNDDTDFKSTMQMI